METGLERLNRLPRTQSREEMGMNPDMTPETNGLNILIFTNSST